MIGQVPILELLSGLVITGIFLIMIIGVIFGDTWRDRK